MRSIIFLCAVGILVTLLLMCVVETGAQEQPVLPYLNEFLANPEGTDTDQEWVEIYHPGQSEISLTGWELMVDDKAVFVFGDEIISPGEYKLVQLQGSKLPNCSSQPCTIRLGLQQEGIAVDNVEYDHTTSSISWSRTSDGQWTEDYANSPGAENLPPPPIVKTLLISEIYPSPNSGEEEWVEIFNWGTEQVNLAGWQLTDLSSKTVLADTSISPGQYLLLTDLSISLNNTGDTISLIAPDTELVDQLVYGQTKKGESVARFGVDWQQLESTNRPTPQAANLLRYNAPVPSQPVSKTVPPTSPPPATPSSPVVTPPQYQLPVLWRVPGDLPQPRSVVQVNLMGLWVVCGLLACLSTIEAGYVRQVWHWWQAS